MATDERPMVWARLDEILARLDSADGLVVLLDFDGTLAPIEDDPEAVALPKGTREALDLLASRSRVRVAVVSGRRLADVRERVGLPELAYAGNHGLRIQHGDEVAAHPEARAAEEAIAEAAAGVDDRLSDLPGSFVEEKGLTATVHYRQAPDSAEPVVREAIEEELVEQSTQIEVTDGKQIFELRPPVDWDKGRAVEWLTGRLVPDDERWIRCYVGDDVTDEAAFEVLGDRELAIVVGDESVATVADFRLPDPESVQSFITWLAGPVTARFDRERER